MNTRLKRIYVRPRVKVTGMETERMVAQSTRRLERGEDIDDKEGVVWFD